MVFGGKRYEVAAPLLVLLDHQLVVVDQVLVESVADWGLKVYHQDAEDEDRLPRRCLAMEIAELDQADRPKNCKIIASLVFF